MIPNLLRNFALVYSDWVIKRRWAILVVGLISALAAGSGLARIQFTADYRAYFGPNNPQLLAYDALENVYIGSDNILFVLKPASGGVFTRKTLRAIKDLTDVSWRIPYASRVDSITNFQHTRAEGDDLTVADLVVDPEVLSDAMLTAARDVALNEPALRGRLISLDGGTTGVVVTFQFPLDDRTGPIPEVSARAREIVDNIRAVHPGLTVAITGMAAFGDAMVAAAQKDMRTLVPAIYGCLMVLLFLFYRSFWAMAATMLVISMAAAAATGLGAWLGIEYTPGSAIAPVIILTLAVADCVHILMTVFYEMGEGRSKHDALVESMRVNTEPVFLTSLTTAVGFLCLNFSDSPPFGDMGNVSAIGAVAAWAYSMIFLPALMAALPLKARKSAKRAPMGRLGDFLVVNRRRLLWGISAGAVLIAGFLPLNVLEDRFIEYLDESIPMRVDTDFAVEHLTGAYVMEFSVPAGAPGAVSEPEYLDRLENFANWLRAQPEIDHVTSFTDVMKRLNKSMHGDDQAWYRLPERRDLAAQYLLLYEMSLPYGLDLNTQINVDKSATRLTVILENIPSTRMRDVKTRAEIWLQDNALPEMGSEGTGPAIMFAYISQRNIQTMFVGTGVAFLLISAILVLTLHSVRLGLISLIPNILPALITFGLWGLFVGHVGLAAAAIMATTMGLVVDDTVHVLSIYNRARREHCFGTHDAIRFCYAHVGKALFVTTAVLVAGFGILGTSSFGVNANQGQLTAIALTVALALDFLLLPSLLMYLDEEPVCECVTCVAANLKEQGT